MSGNQNPEIIECYLERERGPWLVAKARDDRAGGNNAEARQERAQAMERLDEYLDEYLIALGGVAMSESPAK